MTSVLREAGLTATDVEVLAWRYCDGRSLRDIADLLGVRHQTVADRLDKCCRLLDAAGIPRPKPVPRPTGVRTIRLDEHLMEKAIHGGLPPLLLSRMEGWPSI